MRYTFLIALLALLFAACGSDTASATAETEKAAEEQTTENAVAPQNTPITIEPMSASPDFPGAGITSMSYKEGQFTFGIEGGENGYALKAQTADAEQKMCANSGKGQHIHLIVDNDPYAAKYDASFEHKVTNGDHYILAFISRSYHESIKHPGAAVVQKVAVENGSIVGQKDVPGEVLFYSRPKGTYSGKDTENIMLDFYLHNIELGADRKVKVDVGDQTFTVDKWQPYILKGLPMGENKVTLTLVDAEGIAVPAPLNPVTRVFTLKEDKTE